MVEFIDTPQGRRLAYQKLEGAAPCVVFLCGLKSDMEGTKALFLEALCRAQGRAFLRFDYSGHGQSSGRFEEGSIGDWHEDTLSVVDQLTEGDLVIVGSSMGGWQALLLAKERAERIVGLVTVAAAPDFMEDSYWANFTAEQKTSLEVRGFVEMPSDYMEPFVISKRMIEDGREHLVLRDAVPLPFPTRFLQGTEDTVVTREVALRLLDAAEGEDMRLTLVKGADHSFSDPACLDVIAAALAEVCQK